VLPSEYRMRHRDDFRVTVRAGTRGAGRTLVVHLVPGSGEGPARIGLVVSRSLGGAVVRNAVRRRLRSLLRERLARFPTGSRVVVRALPDAAAASSARLADDLDAALDAAWRRAGRAASVGVRR
jgi:ribonuclease P protein component